MAALIPPPIPAHAVQPLVAPVVRAPLRAPCPPKRKNCTQGQIIQRTLSCTLPTFMDLDRAWVILGYRGSLLPTQLAFETHMNRMWYHLSPVDTEQAQKAKTAILDALKAIGYWSPRWNTKTQWLGLMRHATEGTWEMGRFWGGIIVTGPPRANYLPEPNGIIKARLLGSHPHARTPQSEVMVQEEDLAVWQKFHRYQNFMAKDRDQAPYLFRTIHIPEGRYSLWQAVQYCRRERANALLPAVVAARRAAGRPYKYPDGSFQEYYSLKAEVWAFFMQSITDNTHPRFRDYNLLNQASKVNDPLFGELSIIRCLHSNEKTQGKAAYPPADGRILYVIADFLATQIVVFYWDPARVDPIVPGGVAGPLNPNNPQYENDYSYRIFGEFNPRERQIFLVTNDWLHFDACEWAPPEFGAGGAVPVGAPARFLVDPGYMPHQWWDLPGAAHGNGALGTPAGPPIHLPGLPPYMQGGLAGRYGAAGVGAGAMAAGQWTLVTFTNAINEMDVEGLNVTLPTPAVMGTWVTYDQPAAAPIPIGPAAAPRYGYRFGSPAAYADQILENPRLLHDESPAVKWMHRDRGTIDS